jgi:hypothetical protein
MSGIRNKITQADEAQCRNNAACAGAVMWPQWRMKCMAAIISAR